MIPPVAGSWLERIYKAGRKMFQGNGEKNESEEVLDDKLNNNKEDKKDGNKKKRKGGNKKAGKGKKKKV